MSEQKQTKPVENKKLDEIIPELEKIDGELRSKFLEEKKEK